MSARTGSIEASLRPLLWNEAWAGHGPLQLTTWRLGQRSSATARTRFRALAALRSRLPQDADAPLDVAANALECLGEVVVALGQRPAQRLLDLQHGPNRSARTASRAMSSRTMALCVHGISRPRS